MESAIARELRLRHQPVAVLFTDEKPADAVQFQADKWGCVTAMHAAASRGKTVVFDRERYGCPGGGVGLGFGNTFREGTAELLSTGSEDQSVEGEAYKRTPELAQAFLDQLPVTDVPAPYVVFEPLSRVDPDVDEPMLVTFYVNADQLSALVALANYNRPTGDNTIIPGGAGCQTICLLPLHEARQERPRGVVGMTDLTARQHLDPDLLSYTVPFTMFQEMEGHVAESFLSRPVWKRLKARIEKA